MPFTRDATPQMTASRRARREALKCPNPALHPLLREQTITCGLRLDLGHLGASDVYTLYVTPH
ncbi:MAG: hypothetical protein HKP12_04750 [Gammaproteobacteria bacterium]|nr:hypothetical protein [Gammaproteobacteria bacterium]